MQTQCLARNVQIPLQTFITLRHFCLMPTWRAHQASHVVTYREPNQASALFLPPPRPRETRAARQKSEKLWSCETLLGVRLALSTFVVSLGDVCCALGHVCRALETFVWSWDTFIAFQCSVRRV